MINFDLKERNLLNKVGEIAQCLFPGPFPHALPDDIVDAMMTRPKSGFELLLAQAPEQRLDNDRVRQLLTEVSPDDLHDPAPGQRNSEWRQAAFRSGYERSRETPPDNDTPVGFADVGVILFGLHWKAPMALELGFTDTQMIERWLADENTIPLDVWRQLWNLLAKRNVAYMTAANTLRRYLDREQGRQALH